MGNFILKNTHSDYKGYQQLITQYQLNKHDKFNKISVQMDVWFDAPLSASLGGILDILKENLNEINIENIHHNIEHVLKKNNFLSYYSYMRELDEYNTTIAYQKLKPTDGRFFFSYIKNKLLKRPELPHLSAVLKDKIAEVIFEIFTNAQIHSNSKQIYTCGQFFPSKNTIEFSIVDTGIGFKKRINADLNENFTAEQAIRWAFEDRNTTKRDIPGGIGLALLKEFIALNEGEITVVSNDGFYKFDSQGETACSFNGEYPGTIVNMRFNTNDNCSYASKNETDNDDIF